MAGGVPVPGLRVNGVPMGEARAAPITIGRNPASDVVVANPVVSGRHATIELEGGTWVVRDAGSTNGTYLDGVRTGEVRVTGRIVLMLGHPNEGSPLEVEPMDVPAPAPPTGAPVPAQPIAEPTTPLPPVPAAPAGPPIPAGPPGGAPAPAPWAPPPVAPPGTPSGAPFPSSGPPPVLQSRVVWTRRLMRDDPGVLKLEGDRVVFASDAKGRLVDAPLAGLDATFSRDGKTVEIHHGAKTYNLLFPDPYGAQAAVAWRQLIESRQWAAPPAPGFSMPGAPAAPPQQGWDGSGTPPSPGG